MSLDHSLNLGCIINRRADPRHIAFITPGASGHSAEYCFGDIDSRADAIARGLRAAGHEPGERIALLAANSVDYLVALLGILRAGLVAVPVNFKFPVALIALVLRDSGARLVLCDAARSTLVPDSLTICVFGSPAFAALADAGPFSAVIPESDTQAMLLYTSGSTGQPKGVRLSHASHRWVVEARRAATPLDGERVLIAAPLYHMNALALVLLTLASHATAVLLPQFSATAYIDAIDRYRCTWLTAVPPMIAMMMRESGTLATADLSSVRVVRMGSAPVSPGLLAQINGLLPNARVINAYGTTEGGPVVFGPHPLGLSTPDFAIGFPHPQVDVRLIDASGAETDEGVLEIHSPGLMLGYHQRPELVPFTSDGYYVTGDVFTRDANGFYRFIGRRDDMFVSGGENLYPGEIEKALERHPAVQQASVVPVPDDIKGTKPVAFVVIRAGVSAPNEAMLKQFSLQHLAVYQHPRRIWFVDALPFSATQKIDRQALLQDALRLLSTTPAFPSHLHA
jgi:long-chain acyl-CoA synthetase